MHPHPTRSGLRDIDLYEDIYARFETGEEHELIAFFKTFKLSDIIYLRGYQPKVSGGVVVTSYHRLMEDKRTFSEAVLDVS